MAEQNASELSQFRKYGEKRLSFGAKNNLQADL